MKKLLILCLAVGLTGCGIYKRYSRPEAAQKITEGAYGNVEGTQGETLGDVEWRTLFTDPQLQTLIAQALEKNSDMQAAKLKIDEARAQLQTARLSYLPSLNFNGTGSLSSFDTATPSKVYTLPIAASWQFDLFNSITNQKRRAKAGYELSKEYAQAVRAQLIAGVANLYYTLLMLDEQVRITDETAAIWKEIVEKTRAMKEAGMVNDTAVAQYEATYKSIRSSLEDLKYSRTTVENSLCSLLFEAPHTIARGKFANQQLPETYNVGVPVQMLANRPDVRIAEYSLMAAYYATSAARSKMYPSITLSGTVGWTNNSGMGIVNPGKLILTAAATVLQPIFNARANANQVKIMKAQQKQAELTYEQTILNAGAEVNNAIAQCQSARAKRDLRAGQVEALKRAVESTELLMQHGSTTYLEVLTARQSLLSAELSQIADRYDELNGVVTLYQALGGGREKDTNTKK